MKHISYERDGERNIAMQLPEGLTRQKAKGDISAVMKRIFNDVKEVF